MPHKAELQHQPALFRVVVQLQLLGPDGSLSPVYSDDTELTIAGGLLQLPAIDIKPEWFTAATKGMATLVLVDSEPDPVAAGPSNAEQWQWQLAPQKQLGRIYLRLAAAAEQLVVMAAGPLFKQATVWPNGNNQQGGRQGGQRGLQVLQEVRVRRPLPCVDVGFMWCIKSTCLYLALQWQHGLAAWPQDSITATQWTAGVGVH